MVGQEDTGPALGTPVVLLSARPASRGAEGWRRSVSRSALAFQGSGSALGSGGATCVMPQRCIKQMGTFPSHGRTREVGGAT